MKFINNILQSIHWNEKLYIYHLAIFLISWKHHIFTMLNLSIYISSEDLAVELYLDDGRIRACLTDCRLSCSEILGVEAPYVRIL